MKYWSVAFSQRPRTRKSGVSSTLSKGGGSDIFDVFAEDQQCMSGDFGPLSEMAETAPLYDGDGTTAEPALLGDDFS